MIIYRVWCLHERMNHISLTILAGMARQGTLINSTCTEAEILLVRDHQDCWACAMAKWRALSATPNSGILPNMIGAHWTADTKGPYKTLAIGGWKYKFIFVERSLGYFVVFLGKLKSDICACVDKLNRHCRRYGYRWLTLRTDMGSVENGSEFIKMLHDTNEDRQMPGVELIPANTNCQEQNPAERHIQTFDNNETAMIISQDLLGASCWALAAIAMAYTMNSIENEHTRGSTPRMEFEGTPTDLSHEFKIGWGRPVICTRVTPASSPRLPGVPRNQFGVAVGQGRAWGSVWVLFADGQQAWSICLRKHARELTLGVQKQMSLEEGQLYMPTLGPNGEVVLVTRGDHGILGKQFAVQHDEPLGWEPDATTGEVRISSFDSTLSYADITDKMESNIQAEIEKHGTEVQEEFEKVHIDSTTGELHGESGSPIESDIPKDIEIPMSQSPSRPRRSSQSCRMPVRYVNAVAATAYQSFVTILFMAGLALCNQSIDSCPLPMNNNEPLMVMSTVSYEEYLRKNPKWAKAIKGPDKDKWIAADSKERLQQMEKRPGRDAPTMEPVSEGKQGVPYGAKIYPIKRHCKIKSDGTYKVRWVVLGNLDDNQGDTYAPTASRKTIWLLFALSIVLGMYRRFFDITGAFMAEKPTRDIYVTIDSVVYILRYSLYGLKDAPKLFNDGLVQHLVAGGYIQSKWDQCLFYKWVSCYEYIYIVFHVDDFIVNGSSERMIDDYQAHMATKYEITANDDGVFLGIHIQKFGDDGYLLQKPSHMQNIFDKYLPNGPTVPSAPKEPIQTSYMKAFSQNDSEINDITEFRSMLGAVIQLTDVRPDIAFAISKISQRQCKPRKKDILALLYLINYLY